jgi:hypothetical protein
MSTAWQIFRTNVLVYDTKRLLRVRSGDTVGVYFVLQIFVFFFAIVYALLSRNSFQRTDQGVGVSDVQFHGQGGFNGSLPWLGPAGTAPSHDYLFDTTQIWDPVQWTVMTNLWVSHPARLTAASIFKWSHECTSTKTEI